MFACPPACRYSHSWETEILQVQSSYEIKCTVLGRLVDHVRVVQVTKFVDLQDLRIRKVVPDQEPVLFAFEPALGHWEDAGAMGRRNFELDIIHEPHVVLELFRLASQFGKCDVLPLRNGLGNSGDGVSRCVLRKEAQLWLSLVVGVRVKNLYTGFIRSGSVRVVDIIL